MRHYNSKGLFSKNTCLDVFLNILITRYVRRQHVFSATYRQTVFPLVFPRRCGGNGPRIWQLSEMYRGDIKDAAKTQTPDTLVQFEKRRLPSADKLYRLISIGYIAGD